MAFTIHTIHGTGAFWYGKRKHIFRVTIQGLEFVVKAEHPPGPVVEPPIPYFGRKIEQPPVDQSVWSTTMIIDDDWKNRELIEQLANDKTTFDMQVKRYTKTGELIADQSFTGVAIAFVGSIDMMDCSNSGPEESSVDFRFRQGEDFLSPSVER